MNKEIIDKLPFHKSISKIHKDMSNIGDFLKYDEESGDVFWIKKACANTSLNVPIRSLDTKGYYKIGINYKTYRLHRICWLLKYGKMPNGVIDHIDGDIKNNAISNLRDVTSFENQRNCKCHRNGKVFGVIKYNRNSEATKFGAFSTCRDKKFIGYYPCELQAEMASVMFDNGETVNNKNKTIK